MKILITGGAGFIGSQIGFYLEERGSSVILLDNMSYGHADNLEIGGKPIGSFVEMDVREDFSSVLDGVDAVIHLAAIAPLPDCQSNPINAIDNNIAGTANVIDLCRKHGISKIIFASTSAIYENSEETPYQEDAVLPKEPDLIYAWTKRSAERLCDSACSVYGMNIVSLRFFNVYGPHQDFRRKQPPLMGYITKCMLENENPTFFSDGYQQRDYAYVDDLCRMVEIVLGRDDLAGEKFNVCSGRASSVREIFEVYASEFESKVVPSFQPSKDFWNKYPSLFEGTLPLKTQRLVKEVEKYSLGSYDKAEKILGWRPQISLEEGISRCVKYAKSRDA